MIAALIDLADKSRLARMANRFAFDLYPAVAPGGGNVALSPASVAMALAMTARGARGSTAEEITRALRVEGEFDAVWQLWGHLVSAAGRPDAAFKLTLANRMFGDAACAFEPEFARALATVDAGIEALDFRGAPGPSCARVNAWVTEKTEGRIRDLVPDAVTSDTRLILANAVHFLAEWEEPFTPMATVPIPFTLADGTSKRVPTMQRRAQLALAEADDARCAMLPYRRGEFGMLIVLPRRPDGLRELEGRLPVSGIAAWLAALSPERVDLAVPRFEISPSGAIRLRPALEALGVHRAFDRELADFTGIANPEDANDRLCIADAFHKAYVRVDEKGTEAAAATAVVMPRGAAAVLPKAVPFRVDRPFLFFIVERASGLVLFMGRVDDPSQR